MTIAMPKRAVFLDLNGTLVMPVLVERLADLKPIDGVAAGVARLCQAGFLCPVVTVQSRIEKGFFTESDFRQWFAALARDMAAHGATLHGPYVCPHRFSTSCDCAKPEVRLFERAARDLGLELSSSFVIGDSLADVEAATRFGGRGCLIRAAATSTDDEAHARRFASYISGTFGEAVDWILSQETSESTDTFSVER
ncbi:MAG: HAD-IIIA family hydrolase [Acidobacteria bacterium]|nr:HAD-IIIA family hydrolase [Acidobacteriota bacterium]